MDVDCLVPVSRFPSQSKWHVGSEKRLDERMPEGAELNPKKTDLDAYMDSRCIFSEMN